MTAHRNPEGSPLPEVWLRGQLPDVPPLLQPVAHALLQARNEIDALLEDFPEELLWTRPGGVASAGFHLQHLVGIELFHVHTDMVDARRTWSRIRSTAPTAAARKHNEHHAGPDAEAECSALLGSNG